MHDHDTTESSANQPDQSAKAEGPSVPEKSFSAAGKAGGSGIGPPAASPPQHASDGEAQSKNSTPNPQADQAGSHPSPPQPQKAVKSSLDYVVTDCRSGAVVVQMQGEESVGYRASVGGSVGGEVEYYKDRAALQRSLEAWVPILDFRGDIAARLAEMFDEIAQKCPGCRGCRCDWTETFLGS